MEKNKIILCIGITYSTMAVIGMFYMIPSSIMLGISIAGICFSCGQILNGFKVSREDNWVYQIDFQSMEDPLETIMATQAKTRESSFIYRLFDVVETVVYCIGFSALIIVPSFQFPFDVGRASDICSIASLSIIFLSVYFENIRQEEKKKKTESMVMNIFLPKKSPLPEKKDPGKGKNN